MKKIPMLILLVLLMTLNASAQEPKDTLLYSFNTQQENSEGLFQNNNMLQGSNTTPQHFGLKQSFKRNATFAGLVFIADGLLIKAQKKDFRSIKTFFQPHFKQTYDNYTQFAPIAATFALKAFGVKNASSWGRLTLNSAMSYIAMAAIVNTIKYSSKEMRPDNSTANSFPSGHTATAFTAATIFHKEYGHLSPWYSVAGYTVASFTGITRIMNNRHWISDVLVGAGIGIVSTDLGYMIGDLILRGKGVQKTTKDVIPDLSEDGSFFSLTVGTGYGPKYLNVPDISDDYNDDLTPKGTPMNLSVKAGRSTSVNVEGAYYFNKYLGVGGRLKATSLPLAVDGFNSSFKYGVINGDETVANVANSVLKLEGLESSHLGMIDMAVGLYGSLPIGTRLRVGTKFLIGNRLTTDYSVDAIFSIDTSKKYGTEIKTALDKALDAGDESFGNISKDQVDPNLYHDADFMEIKANNALTVGTGLSLTYAIKNNIAFRFSLDYDFAEPKYTFLLHNRSKLEGTDYVDIEDSFERRTSMNNFSFNLGMSVCL